VDRVRKKLDKYEYEYQIEADLLHSFRNGGASGQAFHPIVAGGKNACTIHYFANKDNLAQSRFVLLDVGAEVENYAADIGCTYWKEERNKREKNIYDAVVEVQQYAYSILKPGIIIKDYEKQIEQFMGEKQLNMTLSGNTSLMLHPIMLVLMPMT
jgi:Xaa-Pro aminopeptidase